MEHVLEAHASTLGKEFPNFCLWNYYTGSRADSVKYYPDARLLPEVSIRDRVASRDPSAVFQKLTLGFAVDYLQLIRAVDTATFIVANVNMEDALGSRTGRFPYQVHASASKFDGGTTLAYGWCAAFSAADPAHWSYSTVLTSGVQSTSPVIAFPNPFHTGVSALSIGPLEVYPGDPAPRLSIYTASQDVVYSGWVALENTVHGTYARWDGRTTNGGEPASGIYLYVLSAGNAVVKGKFAIVR
jgi:hypothetical protein